MMYHVILYLHLTVDFHSKFKTIHIHLYFIAIKYL